jgi:phage terminase large subunit-like protein
MSFEDRIARIEEQLAQLLEAPEEEPRPEWREIARPNQLPPDWAWRVWMILAGRGWGKTRTGGEQVLTWVREGYKRIALVGETVADVRDVMIEGESGIMNIALPHERPHYEPSKRLLTFPGGAIAKTYSAEKPGQLRGPQHEKAWADELAKWRYAEAWDQLMLGLRLGDDPQVIVTTTPRPIKIIKYLMKLGTTHLTTGTTYENLDNLADAFRDEIITKYEGTRLGAQELNAIILDDMPGALWTREILENCRVSTMPDFKRIVVGVDPAVTANEETSNETGIIVAGLGADGHGYIIDDLSLVGSPAWWGRQVVTAFNRHKANLIVAEVNNGGDLVERNIKIEDKTNAVKVKQVRAARGKYTRAEPVSALYEQGKIHHIGLFGELEDQMCSWVPGEDSPDRVDALVWALHELMELGQKSSYSSVPVRGLWDKSRGGSSRNSRLYSTRNGRYSND